MTISTADGLDGVLEDEHWETHILKGHPELAPYHDLVVETLKTPDGVYRSKRDGTTRVYVKSCHGIVIGAAPVESIALLVFVQEKTGFVATAYFAAAIWRGLGARIWPS